MDKISLFKLSGLPDSFGAVLFVFSFIFFLSPYLSGSDFGVFKIPSFDPSLKRWLKVIGPMFFIGMVVAYLPLINKNFQGQGENINAQRQSPTPTPTINSTSTASPTPVVSPSLVSSPNQNSVLSKQVAEKIGANWLAAIEHQDIETLVRLSDPPFYFDSEILVQTADIQNKYTQTMNKMRGGEMPKLRRIRVASIGELKNEAEANKTGFDPKRDRLLSSLNLTDEDLVIILTFANKEGTGDGEATGLYTRRVGNELRLAGFWN